MSNRNLLSQRDSTHDGLFAALACAVTLTLTAAPALAQGNNELERMEVNGRPMEVPVRRDIVAQCRDIGAQLNHTLQTRLNRDHAEGSVQVRLLVAAGRIVDARARGNSMSVTSAVRHALQELDCGPQALTQVQIYRFSVEFVDPDAHRDNSSSMASAQPGITVAAVAND